MLRTDDLQLRIMRELTSPGSFRWDIRESYAAMAERLKVDEETVRRGVNRARELGFLKTIQLVLNPHLIGRESAGIQGNVEDPEKKQSTVSQIEQLDGVVIIINLIGKPLRTIFYYRDEKAHARTVQQIKAICGSGDTVEWRGGFPPANLNLHTTDSQIIKALRKDPRRPTSDLARDVGVSTKTVKRRLTLMTEGRAFYLLPELNYDKYPGVASDYLISIPDEAKKATIDKQIRAKLDRLVFSFTDAKEFSIFAKVCLNMSEADETQKWIQGIDGVKNVRMDLMRETTVVKGWLDREIETRLQNA